MNALLSSSSEALDNKIDALIVEIQEMPEVNAHIKEFYLYFEALFSALPGSYQHGLLAMEAMFNASLNSCSRESYLKGLQETSQQLIAMGA